MSRILAIDPGPKESAWVWLVDGVPGSFGITANADTWDQIATLYDFSGDLVIESVESYGMPVGRSVFETCYWIGRFDPHCTATLLPRREIKLHLCGQARAKDSNIRQALIDRFGPGKREAIGLKASPGPLYGFKSHLWSALAVGVTYLDQNGGTE